MKRGFGRWLAALSIAFGSPVAAQPVAGQQAEKTYSVGILCGGCSDQEAPSSGRYGDLAAVRDLSAR